MSGTATPTGAGFDLVLIAHVAAVLVGFGSLAVSGVQAGRLLAAPPGAAPPSVARYFVPGPEVVGRVLYAVPLLGAALVGLSHGAYDYDDAWVALGLGAWVLVIFGAEGILWPAERRLGRALAGASAAPPDRGDARRVLLSALAGFVLGLAASVVMVGKP